MPVEIKNTQNPYSSKINQTITKNPQLYKSPLNTPVVTDLTLVGATDTDHNGKSVTFKSIVLVTALISVSQSKRIVCTEIPDMDGTIKEYIGMDDYHVSINGILTGPNGSYPMSDVNALHQICKGHSACRSGQQAPSELRHSFFGHKGFPVRSGTGRIFKTEFFHSGHIRYTGNIANELASNYLILGATVFCPS